MSHPSIKLSREERAVLVEAVAFYVYTLQRRTPVEWEKIYPAYRLAVSLAQSKKGRRARVDPTWFAFEVDHVQRRNLFLELLELAKSLRVVDVLPKESDREPISSNQAPTGYLVIHEDKDANQQQQSTI